MIELESSFRPGIQISRLFVDYELPNLTDNNLENDTASRYGFRDEQKSFTYLMLTLWNVDDSELS